ncbi:MAG TPA: hypothetical protein VFL47_03225, partial [Flavisolibacter sp.]|nr:hypothetical protein [Flavisolibacter sp.]
MYTNRLAASLQFHLPLFTFSPMMLLKKILEKLNGLQYRQDYLCFATEAFQEPLQLYLVQQGSVLKDITHLHAFVGYCPVVFALPQNEQLQSLPVMETVFSRERLFAGEKYRRRQAVASLVLKKIHTQSTREGDIVYFEAVRGRHRFTSPFHQAVGQLYNRLYNQKPGNVFLKGNLYKQVQIAYALPRKICLITVGQNGLYNLFPTDLHGPVGKSYYIVSLRAGGKACEQVMEAKKIVLSDMKAAAYKNVYRFGKNHMQPLKDASQFDFSERKSTLLQLPLPNDAIAYKELQLA